MIMDIYGDCCYLSLIDPLRYSSFVGPDWAANERLLEPHFITQGSNCSALVWDTGFEADWRVEIREGISTEKGFREVTGSIRNSGEALYIANYDSLSMSAQFADHRLPDEDCARYKISLPSALYTVRVVQRVNPATYFHTDACENPERPAEFLIEYARSDISISPWSEVPWSSL